MDAPHPLYLSFKALNADRTVTTEDYYSRQRSLLKDALAALKEHQHPDLDCLVGTIALYDGDKFNIPLKNALGHLNRAYKNGSADAGLTLSAALRGVVAMVPEEFLNKEKSLEILTDMAAARHPSAIYELSAYYLDQIIYTIDGGGYAPDEWFDLCHKYALAAADAGFIGGYTMMGFFHKDGFGHKIPQDHKESYFYYQKAADKYSGALEEQNFLADAKFNLGSFHYDALGVQRDRKKGLALINEAADLGHLYAQDWLSANHDLLVKEGLIGNSNDIAYEESFDDFDLQTPAVPAAERAKDTRH